MYSSNANRVFFFFEKFFNGLDHIRALGLMHLALAGEATSGVILDFHLHVDLMPTKANDKSLAEALVVTGNLSYDTVVDSLNKIDTCGRRSALDLKNRRNEPWWRSRVAGDFRQHKR